MDKKFLSFASVLFLIAIGLVYYFWFYQKSKIEPLPEETNQMTELLKIETLKEGNGAIAKNGDVAVVHYTGWLADGTKFDSSIDSGNPFSFTLGSKQVIAGWEQGVLGMKAGEKRKLTIAPDLAYGASGFPGVIPPNATLIFEVELLQLGERIIN